MKDRICVSEDGLLAVSGGLSSLSEALSAKQSDLSVVGTLMQEMPNLLCDIFFGNLSPIYGIVSRVRRGISAGTIFAALYAAKTMVNQLTSDIDALASGVRNALNLFLNAEAALCSSFESNGRTSDPFDLNGQNGGDQGSPAATYLEEYDEYARLIEQNSGRTFRDVEDLRQYLDELNAHGCGYVALINAIFAHYKGRPLDFERDFGIPMYKNGEYNYNELLVDFYSTVNQPGTSVSVNPDGHSGNADDFMRTYFESKGLTPPTVHYELKTLTADQYRQMMASGEYERGEVFISLHDPIYMRYADGTKSPYFGLEDGHALTVIGTDGDYLLVSSWGDGESYVVDPSDYQDSGCFYVCTVDFP